MIKRLASLIVHIVFKKPRILPARASARLCVRKNSGEHEQGDNNAKYVAS